jgi:CO/xanthine dehydrogenase Mo-binding subunit
MLHVAFVRSPHAHARIVAVDTRAARASAGVVACLSGVELGRHARTMRAPSRMRDYRVTDFPAPAVGKVRHVGEAVAVVVAADRYAAEDAATVAVEHAPCRRRRHQARAGRRRRAVHDGCPPTSSSPAPAGRRPHSAAPQCRRRRFRFHRHAGVATRTARAARWDAADGAF